MPQFTVSGNLGDEPDDSRNPTARSREAARSKAVQSLHEIVQNNFFKQGDVDPATTKSTNQSPDATRIDTLKYSAIESIVSQVMSRVVGTSFYPVVTALRTAREATKIETGTEMGLGDIINFSVESANKLISKGLSSIGLGSLAGSGSKDTKSDELINALDKVAESTNANTDAVKQTSESVSSVPDKLEDLANNAQFGGSGGGGKGTGSGGFNVPPDDESPKDDILKPSEIIAGLVTLFGAGMIAKHITDKTLGALSSVISDQVSYISKTIPNIISNPGSVSGIGMAGQPIKAAVGTAGAFGAPVGAAVGMKLGGAIAGTGVGKAIGGALGSAVPIPVIGTIIGQYVGGLIGDAASSTAGSVISLLQSIDEGVSALSTDLAPFNAELTQARAQSEIDKLQARMRQANEVGPILAENVAARTDFEIALRGLGTELVYAFVPLLTDIYEFMSPIVSELRKIVAGIGVGLTVSTDMLEAITALQTFFLAGNLDFDPSLKAIQRYLDLIANNTKPPTAILDQLDAFINPANPQNRGVMRGPVGAFGGFPVF